MQTQTEMARKYGRVLARSLGYVVGDSIFIGDIASLKVGSAGSCLEERAKSALLRTLRKEKEVCQEFGWTKEQLKHCRLAIAFAGGLLVTGREQTPIAAELRESLRSLEIESAINTGKLVRLTVAVVEYLNAWKKLHARRKKRAIGSCEHLLMDAERPLPNVKLILNDANFVLLPRMVRREIERTAEFQAA
ncbi:MAG: hypothetical protein WC314_03495 [Vulcanimicrobiota bacterium]